MSTATTDIVRLLIIIKVYLLPPNLSKQETKLLYFVIFNAVRLNSRYYIPSSGLKNSGFCWRYSCNPPRNSLPARCPSAAALCLM